MQSFRSSTHHGFACWSNSCTQKNRTGDSPGARPAAQPHHGALGTAQGIGYPGTGCPGIARGTGCPGTARGTPARWGRALLVLGSVSPDCTARSRLLNMLLCL